MNFFDKVKSICTNSTENEPMSRRTTFRVGGAAQIFAEPLDAEQVCTLIKLCRAENVPYSIIGNGSNLLVSDLGIDGVVIHIGSSMDAVSVNGTVITAGCGILLSRLSRIAEQSGLSGLEFASGIPGTLGGGICMNAGAYSGELKDVVRSVTYADENGDIKTAYANELDFSYRHSMFSSRECAVLECTMELKQGVREEISAAMRDYSARRTEKQPLDMPSAGSTFKRPEGHFAGQLIQEAGLKGFSVGGAQVSEKHAGFVVNKGGATSADIEELIKTVQQKVFENSGVMLEPEVKFIGKKE